MILISQAEGGEVVAPAICFVCEHHFDEQHRFVDTEHSFLYPDDVHAMVTHLHGVKYICEHCAISAAGTVMGTDLRELANELLNLQRQVDEQAGKLAAYEGVEDSIVDVIRGIAERRTFVKPGPKPGKARNQATMAKEQKP